MAFLETYKMTNISGAQFDDAIKLVNNSIADEFSASNTYKVGDYVMHNGLLYMCITAVVSAGAWNAAN